MDKRDFFPLAKSRRTSALTDVELDLDQCFVRFHDWNEDIGDSA